MVIAPTANPSTAEFSISFGPYVVGPELAKGGMGAVFVARERSGVGVDRLVALKRIRGDFAEDPAFAQMFIRECKLAAQLRHPNVVHVYRVGRVEGQLYMAMELVHGCSLLQILRATERGHRLPLALAITIVVRLCQALQHAHTACSADGRPLGIVHRDLSPTNVLVSYDGVTKLADFGVARAIHLTRVTPMGHRKGKAGYMSPEQVTGKPLDPRSDVFGLGILLYEMTTMRRLVKDSNPFKLAYLLAEGKFTAPSSLDADYPEELESIVLDALSVDPDDRPGSAAELASRLEGYAEDKSLTLSESALARWLDKAVERREFPVVAEELPTERAPETIVEARASERRALEPTRTFRAGLVAWLAGGMMSAALALYAVSVWTTAPLVLRPLLTELTAGAVAERARPTAAEGVAPTSAAKDTTPSRVPEAMAPALTLAAPPTQPDEKTAAAEAPRKPRRRRRKKRGSGRTPRSPKPSKVERGLDGLLPGGP